MGMILKVEILSKERKIIRVKDTEMSTHKNIESIVIQ